MARIAIVYLPDDHTTDALVTCLTWDRDDCGRLVGLYEFPNRSELRCSGSCTTKGTGAWGRDPHGFMKCMVCGSRNKRVRRWFVGALFDWFGANLLGNKAPTLFRTPEGYGSRNDTDGSQ